MLHACIVVRETGGLAPEYMMRFDLPTLPRVGTYLSVCRPGGASHEGEDLIVRQVWWRLKHPDKQAASRSGADGIGHLDDVIIECAKAIGPYSSEAWRSELIEAERQGLDVEAFDVERPAFALERR